MEEDIGAEVEVNPDDQYQFLSVYTLTSLRTVFGRVTIKYFPASVSYRAMGRSIRFLHYIPLIRLHYIPLIRLHKG